MAIMKQVRATSLLNLFTTIDPFCEKYTWISPYAVCSNNFINRGTR